MRFLRQGEADRTFVFDLPEVPTSVHEFISALLVLWFWITRSRNTKFDLVNFTVAHPNLVHLRLLRLLINVPFVITEHYSAYHYAFNSDSKGVDRIRKLFHQGLPLICVSDVLGQDIAKFSGCENLAYSVIDNVVDDQVFKYAEDKERVIDTLFCVANWQPPKRPDILLKTLSVLHSKGHFVKLRLGGYGKQMESIHSLITELKLAEHVTLLGKLSPSQVADEMSRASAFVHCSDYETFSVVCAEALCCGTPIIASKVGAIPSFISEENGALVQENVVPMWSDAIIDVLYRKSIDNAHVSTRAAVKFSAKTVGERYFQLLKNATDQVD